MDFLVFMTIYLIVFAITIVLYYTVDSSVLKHKSMKCFLNLRDFLINLIPDFISRNVSGGIDHMFYKRNHIFQIIYGSLVLGGHVVLVVDIFPIVYTLAAHENHVTLPLILVLANTLFFNLTCVGDPGEITEKTVKTYAPAYRYDWLMYKPNTKCRTCHTAKLPRSKHCSICNRCVYRFDHHCIWTNNCIGGLNHFYFIMFLFTICVMSTNGIFICWNSLKLVVDHHKMLETSYMDWSGNLQPVTLLVLFQHLFMKFPRIVFTMVSLVFIVLMMASFLLYHVFLMITNQTTNERYKDIEKLKQAKMSSQNGKNSQQTRRGNLNGKSYNQGLYQNVYELVWPKTFLEDKGKEKYG